MRPIRTPVLGLALAAVVLGGGASAPAEEGSKAERVCINRREIASIRALDDEHVFVKLGASRFYLLTVAERCSGLRLARTIGFEGSRTRICGKGLSLVSFEEPTVGPMRCRVEQIESVKDKNAALDLIESRAERE